MLIALAFLAACSPLGADTSASSPNTQAAATTTPRRAMVFMAGYKPQANLPFVAAYVAQQHGLFSEQGLDVTIRHSTQGEHLQLLLAGQVQVTTAAAESVLKRVSDPGVPIRAIALFGQTGDQAYASLTESGLGNPKSWEGRTVGYKLYPGPEYLALLQAAGVDREKVREVEVGYDPRILLQGRVDVYPVFASNEPNLLRKLGANITLTRPADFGIPTLGLTYITTEEIISRDPDLLERFLKATMRAMAQVVDSPEVGLEAVMGVAPDEDREHQRQMLLTELGEVQSAATRQHGLGWMTREQWQTLHDSLLRFGGLGRPLNPANVYAPVFLERIYQNGHLKWP